jgi:hypothetical protein
MVSRNLRPLGPRGCQSAYRLIRVSPTLPDALILFTVVAWFMRLAAAHWLGQHIPHGTWYATILLLIAVIIQGRE